MEFFPPFFFKKICSYKNNVYICITKEQNNMNTAEIKRENLTNLYNEKGQRHGYWEGYYLNGQLSYKGNYVNGERHGYWEYYHRDGRLYFKGNYDMGKEVKEVVELTMDEIAEKFGVSVDLLKIKK